MAYDGSLKFDTKVDSSGFKSGVSKLGSIAKTGLKAVTATIGVVSTALTAASGYAIKVGSDFETGMSKVSAISGATGKDLDALTAKAKEMGAKTKFSATESAQAFEYMAMAGWKTDDMLGGIEGIMNLAAASGEDLASVSDICTDALTAFGLQAKDSGHFADVLAKASSSSNTNVGMMGATFKYVAPIAGAMKYSIEDTATAIGLMANAGIKGEQAGTSLRAMLTRLVDPPADAAEAMKALGLSVTNADGSMRPLNDIIKDMREGFKGLDDSQKASYASSIAGTEAMSGLLAIVNASDEDFNNLSASINNADGAAQDMADTMQDNLQGDITILKSSLEGLGISVYESMQEPLRSAAQAGIEYVGQLSEAFQHGGLQEAVAEAGNIFADLAVKAAEKAPEMINAAVDFIQSFIKGISDHAPQLMEAAQKIVYALVDGLVKPLPGEVQKPVKETVDTLKRSFESGGLREAINTVSSILKNLGKAATNVAKVVLPPLAKAVDFVSGKFKIILPLVVAGVAAFKAYKIVQQVTTWMTGLRKALDLASKAEQVKITMTTAAAVAETKAAAATGASTAALTLKQIAVGVLTGEIGLATAAQWLWNTAMSANPIGAVIALVAALAGGIALLCASLNDGKTGEEQLAEANQALGESFGDILQSALDFREGIDNAKSHLSDFNDTLFASSEEQQTLQDNMEEVQSGITTICKTAADERRGYTEEEITQLDQYFEKMREIADAQLAIQEAKSKTISDLAIQEAETFKGSLGEYQATAQEWIKTSQDQADAQIATIEEQSITELTLLRQRHEQSGTLNSEAYQQEYEEAIQRRDEKIALAQDEVGKVISTYSNGYVERSGNLQAFLYHTKGLQEEEAQENQRHKDKMAKLDAEYAELEKRSMENSADWTIEDYYRMQEIDIEREQAKDLNEKNLAKIRERYQNGLDESTKKELGSWLEMLTQTELYGGEISDENKEFVDEFLKAYEGMDEEGKKSVDELMEGMLGGLEEKSPGLFAKASSIADGVIGTLNRVFGIASPSKVMKRMFGYVMEGAEEGLDAEEPKLLTQTSDIADSILDKFNLSKIDVSAMVQKMKAAVAAESFRMSASLSAPANYTAVRDYQHSEQAGGSTPTGNYVAEVHVDLEGREVARATAPFMGEQLAWEG